MGDELERTWSWFQQHVRWAEGPWLVFVFTESLRPIELLQQRLGGQLARLNRRQRVWAPVTPALKQLDLEELRDPAPDSVLWMEAVRRDPMFWGPREEDSWTRLWVALMATLNEERSTLLTRHQGLIFVIPLGLKELVRSTAPDLWSVRDRSFDFRPPPLVDVVSERRRVAWEQELEQITRLVEAVGTTGVGRYLSLYQQALRRLVQRDSEGALRPLQQARGSAFHRDWMHEGLDIEFAAWRIEVTHVCALLATGRFDEAEDAAYTALWAARQRRGLLSEFERRMLEVLFHAYTALGRKSEARMLRSAVPGNKR